MALSIVNLPDVIIQSGASVSNLVSSPVLSDDALSLWIGCQSIDAAKTYKIRVNDLPDGTGNWYDLTDGTNIITPPTTAGQCAVYSYPCWLSWRIEASVAVGSICTWKIKKQTNAY